MSEKFLEIVIRDPVAEARQAKSLAKWRQRYEWARIKCNVLVLLVALLLAALIAVSLEYQKVTTERDADVAATPPMGDLVGAVALLDANTATLATVEAPPEAEVGASTYSAAVPLSHENQAHLRAYCEKYACPVTMALAVADWETRGTFDMDKVGHAGEVGVMQLNPGPEGRYHAALEAATGLDPTTQEGNIAGGCYLIGQYLDRYGDPEKAAMAYNMGEAGAKRAWAAGVFSTDYSAGVMEALEKWRGLVDT